MGPQKARVFINHRSLAANQKNQYMLKRSLVTLIFCSFALSFCSAPKPSEDVLKASQLYEETLGLAGETRSIFESLEQVMARDTSLLVFEAELRALSEAMAAWDKNAVGVGQEDDHSEHHHHHLHAEATDLSDAELLRRQQVMRRELEEISDRVSSLVEKMMDR